MFNIKILQLGKSMTAIDIEDALKLRYNKAKYYFTNLYFHKWEADFIVVSKSDYVNEFEIKVSYSDFKADFKKGEKHELLRRRKEGHIVRKHGVTTEEMLFRIIRNKSGIISIDQIDKEVIERLPKLERRSDIRIIKISDKIPHRFYYVCPDGVIPKEEVPEYAGLIYVRNKRDLVTIKNAPVLHKEPIDYRKRTFDHLYYRALNDRFEKRGLRSDVDYLERTVESLRKEKTEVLNKLSKYESL